MGRLDGDVAFVTGGGSGIGRAVVDRYVAEGAKVAVLELSSERVEQLATDFGDDVVAVQGDVSSWADNDAAVTAAVEEFGGLDIFVGNAGIFDNQTPLLDYDPDQLQDAFAELFRINVLGYLFGARAAAPHLVESEGNVVFTASYASSNPGGGGILYTASKHAVKGIVRQLALELSPKVRVNGVAPSYVPTNLSGLSTLEQSGDPASEDDIRQRHPLKMVPDVDQYTDYYVSLASDEFAPTTGEVIAADCGLSNRGIYQVSGLE